MKSELRRWFDPCTVFEADGKAPDSWQEEFLRSDSKRIIALTTRQCGKSTTAAALCIFNAVTVPDSLIILLSPTERQSKEIFKKCMYFYRKLGQPVDAAVKNITSLELANGSRIVALPSNEEGVRGYSGASIIVIDEAAQVSEGLYYSVSPMLAVSNGRLIVLSTPFGKRGWFYDTWINPTGWHCFKVTADKCPRIPPEFLESEKKTMGARWYNQEYFCEFQDTIDSVFSEADIRAAIDETIQPLIL